MRIAVAIALLVAAPATANAGVIVGVALDKQTSEPLPGATVVVTAPALAGTPAGITNGHGTAELTGLPPGVYQVTFYYADATYRFTRVTVRDGEAAYAVAMIDTAVTWTGCWFPGTPPLIELEPEIGYELSETDLARIPRAAGGFGPRATRYRVGGFALPAGAAPIAPGLVDELAVRRAGYDASLGGAAGTVIELEPIHGTNEHHQAARLSTGHRGSAWIGGPLRRDRLWYAAGAASGDGASSGLASINLAVTPEHQGSLLALATGIREPVGDGGATREIVTAGLGLRWTSKLHENRTRIDLAASRFRTDRTTRLADRAATAIDDRSEARAELRRRSKLWGHHDLYAGVSIAGEERAHADVKQTYRTRELASWLGDAWDPLPNLGLRAGVRFERERVTTPLGVDDRSATSPRLGLVYDWTKEGRSRAFAHWGRYREPVGAGRPVPRRRDITLAGSEYELTDDLAVGLAYERRDQADGALAFARTRLRWLHATLLARTGQPDPDTGRRHELTLEARTDHDLCFADDLFLAAGLRLGSDQPSHFAAGKVWRRGDLSIDAAAWLATDGAGLTLGLRH